MEMQDKPVITPQVVNSSEKLFNKSTVTVLLFVIISLISGFGGAFAYTTYFSDDESVPDILDVVEPTLIVEATKAVDIPIVSVVLQEDDVDEDITETSTNVKVYMFSSDKFNEIGNIDYTVAVNRSTTREDVATYVIEQIIAGPTEAEEAQSLQDTFGEDTFVWFVGESNCGDKDFDITINNKLADVKFCKQTMAVGDMSGFIVADQIEYSLKQFNTIDKVRILNVNGGCFDDMSGRGIDECIY